jgi:hypothetical protein
MTEELTLDGLITQLRKLRKEYPGLGDAVVTGPGCDLCSWTTRVFHEVQVDTYNGAQTIRLDRD